MVKEQRKFLCLNFSCLAIKKWIFISQPRVCINTVMFIGLSISELGIRFRVNGPTLGLSLLQDLVSVKDGHLWCRVVSLLLQICFLHYLKMG